MALLTYTTYDDIRAALGVSSDEIEDATLSLSLYELNLTSEFEDIDTSIETDYATVAALSSRTAVQDRFLQATRLFATYAVAYPLQTVYEDRTVAAGQLSDISRMMYVSAFDLNLISVGQSDPKLLTDDIEKNLSEVDKVWAVYLASQLRPEEKKLADQFSVEKSAFLNGFIKPALQLARSENPEERAQIQKLPRESLTKALDTNTQLIQFQLDEAQKEYGQSKAHNSIGRWISYATILMGFVTAFLTSEYIRKLYSATVELS